MTIDLQMCQVKTNLLLFASLRTPSSGKLEDGYKSLPEVWTGSADLAWKPVHGLPLLVMGIISSGGKVIIIFQKRRNDIG